MLRYYLIRFPSGYVGIWRDLTARDAMSLFGDWGVLLKTGPFLHYADALAARRQLLAPPADPES
jgi:hypothetical protein